MHTGELVYGFAGYWVAMGWSILFLELLIEIVIKSTTEELLSYNPIKAGISNPASW